MDFVGGVFQVRGGEAEPQGLGLSHKECMNRQLWVCEPRTGHTGWLAPESSPGTDSHVSLSQHSRGNSRSLHP